MTKIKVVLVFKDALFASSHTCNRFICDQGSVYILPCVIKDYFKKVSFYRTVANASRELGLSVFGRWEESIYRYLVSRCIVVEQRRIKITHPELFRGVYKKQIPGSSSSGPPSLVEFVQAGASIAFTIRCLWGDRWVGHVISWLERGMECGINPNNDYCQSHFTWSGLVATSKGVSFKVRGKG